MPDHIVTSPTHILPVWDSFEAVFFVLAGGIIGFVFAYLFPSIWRTIRRRFRSHGRYIVTDIPWHRTLELNLDILPLDKKISAIQETKEIQKNFSLVQLFVMARDFVQRGELRHAVKIYGEILTSDKASTSYIHRALFELAQVYFALGLYTRAFDTGLELLKRKTRDEHILKFVLRVLNEQVDEEKLVKTYRIFKGRLNDKLRKQMAHIACEYAENKLKSTHEYKKVIELTRLALRINGSSTHALFLLWKSSSQTVRNKNALDAKAKWVAFATDLEGWIKLCEDTGLSPHAGARHILSLALEIIAQDPAFEYFESIQNEFRDILDFKKLSASQQKILLESIFSSIILLKDVQTQFTEQDCLLFF